MCSAKVTAAADAAFGCGVVLSCPATKPHRMRIATATRGRTRSVMGGPLRARGCGVAGVFWASPQQQWLNPGWPVKVSVERRCTSQQEVAEVERSLRAVVRERKLPFEIGMETRESDHRV